MAEKGKARPMIAARERGPGPGRYLLPSACGTSNHDVTKKKSSSFSFGTKLASSIFKNTPGPGPAHKVDSGLSRHGKEDMPKYTMAGRGKDFKSSKTPAPGAYSPENVKIDKGTIAPVYSMRPKTKLRPGEKTPASNAYAIPSLLAGSKESSKASLPHYSMTGRATKGGFAEDLAKAPGPGKYAVTAPDTNRSKAPLYSMRARTKMPQDATKKPGPGAHRPEGVTAHKAKASSYSMGVRHSDFLTPLIVDVPDY